MSNRDDELSRREFLQTAAAAASLAVLGAGCADSPGASPDAAAPVDMAWEPGDLAIPQGTAVVSVVGGTDVETMVRRAVAMAGGLDAIQPGQTVFIKPNAVYSAKSGTGIVTSVEVLGAVIRLVKERKPGRIIVGDRSARFFDSDSVLRMTGLNDAALAAGADEVYAAPTPKASPNDWVLLKPPAWDETWMAKGGILAMRKIVEADHFINLPVLKNHRWAVFSLSMKNNIGSIGDDSRDALHFNMNDPDRLGRDIAILNQIFKPLLSVIDAQRAIVNGGPEGILSDAVRTTPGLILAGRDRVALDAAGAAILQIERKKKPIPEPDAAQPFLDSNPAWKLPQIVHGIERGLGVAGPDRAILRFDGVAEAAAIEAGFRRT